MNMEKRENPFEELGLSLKQEIEKEDSLSTLLLVADNQEDANSIIVELKELAESSKHGRVLPKIQKCVNVLAQPVRNVRNDDTIVIATTEDLFPLLYRDVYTGKEKVGVDDLKATAKIFDRAIEQDFLHDGSKILLSKALFKLCISLENGDKKQEQ